MLIVFLFFYTNICFGYPLEAPRHINHTVRKFTFGNVPPVKIQISLCIWIAKVAKFLHADNRDYDQSAQMCRLIKVSIGPQPEGLFFHIAAYIFSKRNTIFNLLTWNILERAVKPKSKKKKKKINLLTAFTLRSAQSSNFVVFKLHLVYFYMLLYKNYVVGTHFNCLNKWIATTYDFTKKIRKKYHICTIK